jgi:hypothetical protein
MIRPARPTLADGPLADLSSTSADMAAALVRAIERRR